MKQSGNILFSGVGGQGILLASELTAHAQLAAGFDVKKSEVHGMAQRGGSVEAHLRYGEKVYSPLIEPGCADILVAFEILEAVRYLPYLHKDSAVVVNTQKILPPAVALARLNIRRTSLMNSRPAISTWLPSTPLPWPSPWVNCGPPMWPWSERCPTSLRLIRRFSLR